MPNLKTISVSSHIQLVLFIFSAYSSGLPGVWQFVGICPDTKHKNIFYNNPLFLKWLFIKFRFWTQKMNCVLLQLSTVCAVGSRLMIYDLATHLPALPAFPRLPAPFSIRKRTMFCIVGQARNNRTLVQSAKFNRKIKNTAAARPRLGQRELC